MLIVVVRFGGRVWIWDWVKDVFTATTPTVGNYPSLHPPSILPPSPLPLHPYTRIEQ